MDGMQTPPGTTECNHSYYTGNSFSVSHSAQQLQNDTPATPMQPPASIQEVDAPASSGVISSSLLSCSAFSSQVTVDPTRYGTGDDMPLADAITQLSFLEFLQRCGVSIALPRPSQPPVSISLQDATVQTTPPCDVSHQVSTQTSVQQDMLSCDVAVQTSFSWYSYLILGCCCADDPTQYLFSACLYADGFSLSFLVFCSYVCADSYTLCGAT